MSKYIASFLRRETTSNFQEVFSAIIFNRALDFGARLYALGCLGKPVDSKLNRTALKNRLGTNYVSIARWQEQILASAMNKKYQILAPDLPVSSLEVKPTP